MAHGGVRYLQAAVRSLDVHQFRFVGHSLHERRTILRNAPHLSRPLEFIIPCLSRFQQLYYGAGVKMYDAIAGSERLIPSRFLSRKAAFGRLPPLHPSKVVAGVSYSDGQIDDARYNYALVESFVAAGGAAFNYSAVRAFERDSAGRLGSAIMEDRISGATFRLRARVFVNATGPYSDHIRQLANPGAASRMRPSKGVHILLPLRDFPDDTALLVPKTEDGRVIFAIPWQGRLLVGTTDDAVPVETEMTVTTAEIDYLLRQLNPYLAQPFLPADVESAFAGIRPLVAAPGVTDTKQLIRDDEVEVDQVSGLVSILGGKWTTYRQMAERTIDCVEGRLQRSRTPSRTRDHLLSGADGYSPDFWRSLLPAVSESTARHLASKYGTNAPKVIALAAAEPDLAGVLVAGAPQIRAQVIYAARNEMATTVEDVLTRRTGLELWSFRIARDAARPVAELLGKEFGWTAPQIDDAVQRYLARPILGASALPPSTS
jgi:glycerol-3-phosphate dehydrogenase